jgi:hypothetical protein
MGVGCDKANKVPPAPNALECEYFDDVLFRFLLKASARLMGLSRSPVRPGS